jgi:predicted SnoaL-like aldol condensation-catalyzing enzyme
VTAVREKTGVPALACAVADASAAVAAAVAGVRNVGADTPVGLSDQFHIGTVTKAWRFVDGKADVHWDGATKAPGF